MEIKISGTDEEFIELFNSKVKKIKSPLLFYEEQFIKKFNKKCTITCFEIELPKGPKSPIYYDIIFRVF